MKFVTFLMKSGDLPKRVVDFPLARDTFRNKILEIVKDFDEQSCNNNGKPWKSSRILRVNPNFLNFSFVFRHFLRFSFFHFFIFSFFFIFCFFSIFFSFFVFFPFFHFSFFFIFSIFFMFSFFFMGAQNLIFCLNFVTISLDSSHVKNQFLGPYRVVPPWALFSFFSPFFLFRFFLTFFLLFIFHFSHFCSFLHFLFFNVFHFFIFSKEKVSSFLLSCISFKYVLLLALVSEFNCFLRSRCSMEMWSPDDIGRDSWDWVGPPAWERACFN